MDALLHLAVANALAAAILAVVAAALGRWLQRPAVVHFLWLLVLLRLLAPPIVGLPVLSLWPSSEPVVIQHQQTAPVDSGAAPAASPQTSSEASGAPAVIAAGPDLVAALGAKETLRTAIALLWLSAAVAILVLAAGRALRFRRLLVSAVPAPEGLQDEAASLARQMGIPRCPPIMLVPGCFSPVLWSLLGPAKILLPRELLAGLGARESAALIAHELAHYRRRDHWVRHVELLAAAFFWWYPLTWWARRAMHIAEEQSCDVVVLRTIPGIARSYAESLCKTVELLSRSTAPLPVAASGIGTTTTLKRRITMIMRSTTHKSVPLALVLLLAAAAIPALSFYPSWTGQEEIATTATPSSEYTGEPISLNFKDADLQDVLTTFGTLTNLKFSIDPSAKGKVVTARYENIPWDQALDMLITDCDLATLIVPGQPLVYVASKEQIEANRVRWQTRPLGLEGTAIADLTIVGTMKMPNDKSIVLLEDQFEVSYIAQLGQKLYDGEVTEIHPERIVFTRSDGSRVVREVEAQ